MHGIVHGIRNPQCFRCQPSGIAIIINLAETRPDSRGHYLPSRANRSNRAPCAPVFPFLPPPSPAFSFAVSAKPTRVIRSAPRDTSPRRYGIKRGSGRRLRANRQAESRCGRRKIYRGISRAIAHRPNVLPSSFFSDADAAGACDHVIRGRTYVPAKIYRGAMGVTRKTRRQSITTGGMHDDHVISNFCLALARIARSIRLPNGRIRANFLHGRCADPPHANSVNKFNLTPPAYRGLCIARRLIRANITP